MIEGKLKKMEEERVRLLGFAGEEKNKFTVKGDIATASLSFVTPFMVDIKREPVAAVKDRIVQALRNTMLYCDKIILRIEELSENEDA